MANTYYKRFINARDTTQQKMDSVKSSWLHAKRK